jgi:hypothetical protein
MAVLRNRRPPRMHPGCADPLLKRKIRAFFFWTIWQKAPFWLVEIQKVMEIWNFEILTGGSRICSCVNQGPAWCLVRQGFGRNSA